MQFLTSNWFFILIFIAFLAMHLTGHGGCSMHAGHAHQNGNEGGGNQHTEDAHANHE